MESVHKHHRQMNALLLAWDQLVAECQRHLLLIMLSNQPLLIGPNYQSDTYVYAVLKVFGCREPHIREPNRHCPPAVKFIVPADFLQWHRTHIPQSWNV